MLSKSYFSLLQNRKRRHVPRLYKILRKCKIIMIITSHILILVPSSKSPCLNISFFVLEFRVSFRTTGGYPSNGSMGIFNNGTWKDLCVANWDVVERNLVCQAQGYNGSSLGVHSKSGTNRSGNASYSCKLTQNCEEKINTEIKCSGIKTFLFPQGENLVRRMSIDTSNIIAVLNLSLK